LRWAIGKLPKRARYIDQNKPVLKNENFEINPFAVVYNKALRVREGRDREPESLLQTFGAWVDLP